MVNKSNKKKSFLILTLIIISCSALVFATDLFLLRDNKQPVQHNLGVIKPEVEVPTDKEGLDKDTYLPKDDEKEPDNVEAVKPKPSEAKTSDEGKPEDTTSPVIQEEYIVEAGDTLFLIGQKLKVDINHLKTINKLDTDILFVGQVLRIEGAGIKITDSKEVASRGNNREDDLYWLSRIIHAEAQGEPYEGKVAVGNVILNRIKSSDFPNTLYGVVFDKQFGYTQFSPVIDGSIYNTPNSESINAAKAALNGERPIGDALYFLNPRKATNFWIVQNRKFFMTIGDHDFYH